MDYLYTADIERYRHLTTSELRERFLLEGLFAAGELRLTYTDIDRAIVGGALPGIEPLTLPADKAKLGADFFLENREIGIINMGGPGTVTCDGEAHAMANRDSLYVGKGVKDVSFVSDDAANPAWFFMTSYPAHTSYPTKLITKAQANKLEMGDSKTCNERIIYQSLVPSRLDTCQLVMGFTELAPGSNWNTFPPHTHKRRMEAYCYFDLDEDQAVFHMMGEADETRHIVVRNGQAVVSPSWSMHSGVGTSNYTFIWAMGGENQIFDDMDHIAVSDLA